MNLLCYVMFFMQNTKTQFEMLFYLLKSINNKTTYSDKKNDRLDQDCISIKKTS